VSGGQTGRTLVACLGNIFLSDDGFGVEVARRLARYELPDGVRVTDYGIRGMHLAYDLAEGFDSTILVDTTQRGGQPGTVYLIEPEPGPGPRPAEPASARSAGQGDLASAPSADQGDPGGHPPGLEVLSLLNAHGMQPDLVLSLAGTLGADAGRVLVVGCEPATLEEGIGLSAPVAAAVDDAVRMVTQLVRGDDPPEPPDRHSAPSGGKPPRQGPDDPKATEG
jgi:hydrogenase maturation protease